MEQFEGSFMVGMDDEAVARRLSSADTGVLSLARDDDAYDIPDRLPLGARFVRIPAR